MKRITLATVVTILCLVMMTVSLAALFIADSNDQLMAANWSFLGWGTTGAIIICTRKTL
jgi:hypothetical protein